MTTKTYHHVPLRVGPKVIKPGTVATRVRDHVGPVGTLGRALRAAAQS